MGWPWAECELAIDQVWKIFMRKGPNRHKVYAFTEPPLVTDDGSKSGIIDSKERMRMHKLTGRTGAEFGRSRWG